MKSGSKSSTRLRMNIANIADRKAEGNAPAQTMIKCPNCETYHGADVGHICDGKKTVTVYVKPPIKKENKDAPKI